MVQEFLFFVVYRFYKHDLMRFWYFYDITQTFPGSKSLDHIRRDYLTVYGGNGQTQYCRFFITKIQNVVECKSVSGHPDKDKDKDKLLLEQRQP